MDGMALWVTAIVQRYGSVVACETKLLLRALRLFDEPSEIAGPKGTPAAFAMRSPSSGNSTQTIPGRPLGSAHFAASFTMKSDSHTASVTWTTRL